MTPEQRAREFVTEGFRSLGVPSLEPYIKIIAELIDGTEQDARRQVGRAMMTAADTYPVGIAEAVFDIGMRLARSGSTEELIVDGLTALADEIRAEGPDRAHS